jgi:hypothetical protein
LNKHGVFIIRGLHKVMATMGLQNNRRQLLRDSFMTQKNTILWCKQVLFLVSNYWSICPFVNGNHHSFSSVIWDRINPSNAELNSIFHFLALLGAHRILHVSRIKVKYNIQQHKIQHCHLRNCQIIYISFVTHNLVMRNLNFQWQNSSTYNKSQNLPRLFSNF